MKTKSGSSKSSPIFFENFFENKSDKTMTTFKKFISIAFVLLFAFTTANAQQIRVYSDLVEEHQMRPGQTETRTVMVENRSDQEQRVIVGLEDYLYGTDRSEHDVDHERSLKNLVSFSPTELRIPPKSRKGITYKVTLPTDAEGSHWAMLTIEPIMPGDALYANRDSSVVIRQRVRWGINVVATAPGGHRSVNHLGTELKDDQLVVSVENDGTVSMRPHYKLRLYDENGNKAHEIEGQQILMHPGTSISTSFDVSEVPTGSYSGVIMIEGEKETFGIRVNVSI